MVKVYFLSMVMVKSLKISIICAFLKSVKIAFIYFTMIFTGRSFIPKKKKDLPRRIINVTYLNNE